MISQNISNVNIEFDGKAEQPYSLRDHFLGALAHIFHYYPDNNLF